MRFKASLALVLLTGTAPALAVDTVMVSRIDAERVKVSWNDSDAVDIIVTDTPVAAGAAIPVVKASRKREAVVAMPANKRQFVVLRDGGDGSLTLAAERELPLAKGSNFRDLGGYKGAGGKTVRWGKVFRSGALPLLTEEDYALLGGLNLGTIVDLRSLEEREVAATQLDDRTGALFISNDYSLKPLMANMGSMKGEYVYTGMEKLLAPQYRSLFKRLLADDGAVMYHCSAGQDRTGIASALILSALGVDRETILADYHLSTQLRRPQNEMPPIDPANFPNNPIVQYYAAAAKKPGGVKAEPLYSASGKSHLAQFFEVIDRDYGGVEGYLVTLGITAVDVARLRSLYLE
ncbi:tyrosine-protein phosphatase [Blastomonas fulva]|uniref:tyrosine-protein phosphatase n=1 Tax=Blastomonas fulva TaxID=1550728 RepID=UPI0025A3C507|nr:tyrosine-protein phosphatase [Blastomonas fulva]MDM7927127.1 tyrosine-protein phosphatase [Blastomonas fulva]MDM7967419.1 tyrosine-protein phosphatase [Blastomonas fulva]